MDFEKIKIVKMRILDLCCRRLVSRDHVAILADSSSTRDEL